MRHLYVFPFMAISVGIYAIFVFFVGTDPTQTLFTFTLPSGAPFALDRGELIVVIGLACLFIELINSMSARARAIVNHALSMGVFILCILLFLLSPRFGSGTFFIITLMSLLDVVAGYSISIATARRDIGIDPTQG